MDYNRIRAANDRLMGHKRVTPLHLCIGDIAEADLPSECCNTWQRQISRCLFCGIRPFRYFCGKGGDAFPRAIMRRAWPWRA